MCVKWRERDIYFKRYLTKKRMKLLCSPAANFQWRAERLLCSHALSFQWRAESHHFQSRERDGKTESERERQSDGCVLNGENDMYI
jgi:hypothetical protein